MEIRSKYILQLLEKAIKNIDTSFIQSYTYSDKDGNESIHSQVERCFAYELYHQLRNLSENSDIISGKIIINAEIPKKGYPKQPSGTESSKDSNNEEYAYPDIVIHGGQQDHNKHNQLLVCEIKRNKNKGLPSSSDIKKDLEKLGWYVKCLQYEGNGIGFKYGCFIMTNTNEENLRKAIEEIKEEITFSGDEDANGKPKEHNISEVSNKIVIYSYMEGENGRPLVRKFKLNEIIKK